MFINETILMSSAYAARIACLRDLRALLTGFTDDHLLLTHFPDKSG
jgi:hypothetical protein